MFNRLKFLYSEYPRQYWLMIIGIIFSTAGGSMIWPFLLIYASGKLKLPLSTVATLISINAGTGLLASFIAGTLADKIGARRYDSLRKTNRCICDQLHCQQRGVRDGSCHRWVPRHTFLQSCFLRSICRFPHIQPAPFYLCTGNTEHTKCPGGAAPTWLETFGMASRRQFLEQHFCTIKTILRALRSQTIIFRTTYHFAN